MSASLSEDTVTARLGIYLAAAQMFALAFAVPDAGLAGGVPETWRAWATSDWLHLLILLAALVAAFTSV